MTDTWRPAKSIVKLRDQVNSMYPGRSKASDGTVGDPSHQSRSSDHNPWIKVDGPDVVSAIDITNDPAHGVFSEQLAERLRNNKDDRIKYVISNKKIFSGSSQEYPAWAWRAYHGTNPHDHHVHVSVKSDAGHYDNDKAWELGTAFKPAADAPKVVSYPLLKKGSEGEDVKKLQKLLDLKVDGDFGPATEKAVKAFQSSKRLTSDGIVGHYTWLALEVKKPEAPITTSETPKSEPKTVNVYIMYGLGGPLFSAGMEVVLGKNLRLIPGVKCPPTFGYTEGDYIANQIKKQPKGELTVVIGHSMGASTATYISDKAPIDLLVLYDLAGHAPSKIGANVKHCIDIYDQVPDIVPEWRVQAVEGYETRIERWVSGYGHTGQDDSIDLMKKVYDAVEKLTK